ncbi:MAG: P-II family nitrogen regulator [Candidatus Halalkalibacterium sp. M3_1C_030]
MNEVKAFIRKRKAEEVVDGLEAEGYCCMTVLEVMGLGRMSDPNKTRLSVSIAERFTDIVKLVIVCDDKDVDKVVSIIQNHARSGQPGDGIIYVTPVSKSVHIRTGKTGGAFLQIERH